MLVLSRKINQSIMIGDDVRIVVVGVDRDQVKLGIEAPREVPVHRSEIYEEIQRANRAAAGLSPESPQPQPGPAPASVGAVTRSRFPTRKKPVPENH
jgi:carbon storage regulator